VGEEEEYTLGKSFTERNVSFRGRSVRSPEVAAAMEREGKGKKERKEERKKEESVRSVMDRTVTVVQGRQQEWRPPVNHGAGQAATSTT
jgi:hypothetical protein